MKENVLNLLRLSGLGWVQITLNSEMWRLLLRTISLYYPLVPYLHNLMKVLLIILSVNEKCSEETGFWVIQSSVDDRRMIYYTSFSCGVP